MLLSLEVQAKSSLNDNYFLLQTQSMRRVDDVLNLDSRVALKEGLRVMSEEIDVFILCVLMSGFRIFIFDKPLIPIRSSARS